MSTESQPLLTVKDAAAWRAWLDEHHTRPNGVWLLSVRGNAAAGVGYEDAVQQALCFGWIDGQRRANDADSFLQRYCPRRKTSSWSQINVGKFEALAAAGRAFGTLGHSERYAVILGLLKARTPERRDTVLTQAIAKLETERQTATSPNRSRQSPQ